MSRLAFLVLLLAPAVAHADVSHEIELGYEASVTGSADGAGSGLAIASIGGLAGYVMGIGEDYTIAVDASVVARRIEGAVRASTLSTRAGLAFGPAALPPANQDGGRYVWFPLSAEVEHEGDLAALPRLSDRPDVARAPYLWQEVAGATRLLRVEFADDGVDEDVPAEYQQPEDRSTGAFDVLPVRSSLAVTEQGGTRLDAASSLSMIGGLFRFPYQGNLDVFGVEQRLTRRPDGGTSTVDVAWMVRAEMVNPATGSAYQMGWGIVLDSSGTRSPRPRVVDHRPRHIGGFGLFTPRLASGVGVQYRREPYLAMDGEPALDDRFWVEGWWHVEKATLSGKGFVARTQRLHDGDAAGVWTGGVELDARRDVGPFDLGVRAEVGQTFYAVLDGAAPTASFGARGALTVRRAAGHRWFY